MLFQLETEGPEAEIYAAAETLGFLEDMEALSLSVFMAGPGRARLEAGYASHTEAEAAAKVIGRDGTITELPDTDWVSEVQKNLAPVRAGRFLLFGSHDRDAVAAEGADLIGIEVEAGPAFGSGHHPTTRGCLEVFSQLLADGLSPDTILDVGCGTGVLAIAAALTTKAAITATDIDDDAVTVTAETAALNHAALDTFQADGLSDDRLTGPYQLVFANILAGQLKGLAPDIEKATAKGGLVILSGLLDEQTESVSAAYAAAGLPVIRTHPVEGWTTLLARKTP